MLSQIDDLKREKKINHKHKQHDVYTSRASERVLQHELCFEFIASVIGESDVTIGGSPFSGGVLVNTVPIRKVVVSVLRPS
jgi:hypothetical protein